MCRVQIHHRCRQDTGAAVRRWHKRPFQTGIKTSSATSAYICCLHFIDNIFWPFPFFLVGKDFFESAVSAILLIYINLRADL